MLSVLSISNCTLSGQAVWKQGCVGPNALRVWHATSRLFKGRTGRGRAGMQNKVGFDQVGWRGVATDQLRRVLVVLWAQDKRHDATTDVSRSTSAAAAAAVTHRRSTRCKSLVSRAALTLVVVSENSLWNGHYSRNRTFFVIIFWKSKIITTYSSDLFWYLVQEEEDVDPADESTEVFMMEDGEMPPPEEEQLVRSVPLWECPWAWTPRRAWSTLA